jgi:ABC-type oligopeptide transport system substrate-binding subunit
MKNPFRLTAAALLGTALLLTACGKPETVTAGNDDPDAATLNAAAPVELPPMVTASRTYRCKDGGLVYVDFFSNNTAAYKTKKEEVGVPLKAAEAGKPYTAEGYSISGDGPQVDIAAPGKPSQSCKA